MTNYLIEFALIHLLLFGLYKLLLRKETQLGYQRVYLLGATLLALIIPLLSFPNITPVPTIDISNSVATYVLPEATATMQATSWYNTITWYSWILIGGAFIMGVRLIWALGKIFRLYLKSEAITLNGRNIRHVAGLETSFTFFKWIFIDKDGFDDAHEIIRHEEAHIKYRHSLDLLLLNLLTVPFWWVPSLWLSIYELKQIHEYQADRFALGTIDYKNYLNTLISHTLKQEGMILTNSFNDTPLTKRLKYMKQIKKTISPWKTVTLLTLLTVTTYFFSCQTQNMTDVTEHVDEQLEDEVFMKVEDPASFDGGIEAFYKYIGENLKYPEQARQNKVSGKVFIEFIVEKDGTVSNPKVLRGIGYGCDDAAIQVIENAPSWNPAKQKGHIVRQKMVLPITFKLDNEEHEIKAKIFAEDQVLEINLPETPAKYPDGMEAFFNYVQENMKYPEEAKAKKVNGRVFVEFFIMPDGSITDVSVLKGIGYGCDEAARKVVENSPNWIPAKTEEGKIVKSRMVLPITFKLD